MSQSAPNKCWRRGGDREDVGGLRDEVIDYRSKEIHQIPMCFFLCVCASLINCTSCADVELWAGWCNVEQSCSVCQMWLCKIWSDRLSSEALRWAWKGLWANTTTHEDNTWKIHFPLYELLCKTKTLVSACVSVFVCVRLLLCEIQRRFLWWQQESRVKPLWFSNSSSSLWSTPIPSSVLFFLSICLSIASSLLPLYFIAAAIVEPGPGGN